MWQYIIPALATVIVAGIEAVSLWERKTAKKEKAEEERREQARENLLMLVVRSTNASIALGEATARAVQRIPDAHCNGDMHKALEYASTVKHDQKEFLQAQGIHAIWE